MCVHHYVVFILYVDPMELSHSYVAEYGMGEEEAGVTNRWESK